MTRLYLIALVLALAGCGGTVPRIKDNFPIAPEPLMVAPVTLKALPEGKLELSTLVDSVKENYAISYEIRIQLESLQEWIKLQTSLFNSK